MNATKLTHNERLEIALQQRNVRFEDDALDSFMPMIHKMVRERPTNAVCDSEDLLSEAQEAALEALLTYADDEEASLQTHVHNRVEYALKEYHKQNYYHLSGGSYMNYVRSKFGPDATIEEMTNNGVGHKSAIAVQYYFMQPSEYGAQFNMVDHAQSERLSCIENLPLDYEKYLTPIECCVVEHIYGLNGCARITMEEIGRKINKSRKAVSYALNHALVKLRHVPGIENYLSYL